MRAATARTIVSDTESLDTRILRAAQRFGVASWSRALAKLCRAVCAGRDVIGIVPPRTSARARSLCWQLPTLDLAKPTVIVVPALDDMPAPIVPRRAAMLYVTPRASATDDCRALLRHNGVSRLVIDEADEGAEAIDPASIADLSRALGAPPLLLVSTRTAASSEERSLSMRAPRVIVIERGGRS